MSSCKYCYGSGMDIVKTQLYRKTIDFEMQGGYVRCWHCNGNGLEPYYPKTESKKDANIPTLS